MQRKTILFSLVYSANIDFIQLSIKLIKYSNPFVLHCLIILAVQLTVHIAALLMHLLPVTQSGWISTSSWATIVDSCITFTVCWTATASNITFHVGSDTVGCARVVVSTRLKTFSNMQRETAGSAHLLINPFLNKSSQYISFCQWFDKFIFIFFFPKLTFHWTKNSQS